jgi:alkylation response protein AidB-like acyl-CoA dehydrogenase
MDFSLTQEHELLMDTCARFADEMLLPHARQAEQAGCLAPEVLVALQQMGIGRFFLAEHLGGEGDPVAGVLSLFELAARDAGGLLGLPGPGPAWACVEVLFACGALGAGTRQEALAKETGPLMVLMDQEGIQGCSAGLSVPWAPGATAPPVVMAIGPREALVFASGIRAEPVAVAAFEASGGVRVFCEGEALRVSLSAEQAWQARAGARLWVGAALAGIASGALRDAISYGRERIVFGTPVLGHQANAFETAAAWGNLEAAKLALLAAAHFCVARANDPTCWTWAATNAYLEATKVALSATDLALGLYGGHGYMRDNLVEKYWREVRMLTQLFGGEDLAQDDLVEMVGVVGDPLVVGAEQGGR